MASIAIEIIASLGLFLFGMSLLEQRIQAASGRSFKRLINTATRTNLRSLTLGFGATILFQSSSIVSLMTLTLIGAGTMSLSNGIGIIFGSNIGSTTTSWIIAVIGFKLDIKMFAYTVIAIGAFGAMASEKETRKKYIFEGMFGFGLLFLGLEGMKDSFEFIAKDFDMATFSAINPYYFVLVGLVLTAIIQASSAALAIAQSALYVGMISFEAAALFAIGANVGTTVTILMGAIGGGPNKKRAASVHILFNVTTGLVAMVLLYPLTTLTFMIIPASEPVIALAMFHTIFNIFGVLLWYFWIAKLAAFLNKRFTKKPPVITKYLHISDAKMPIVAFDALKHEVDHLAQKVTEFALYSINVIPKQALDKHRAIDKLLEAQNIDISYGKLYGHLQELSGEIFDFASTLSLHVNEKEQKELYRLTEIATHLASAAKAIKDMLSDFTTLADIEIADVQRFYRNIRYQILNSTLIFNDFLNGETENLSKMEQNYQKINDAYQKTLENIASIAQHTDLGKNITTVAVNDVHLTRRYTKNLYRALEKYETAMEKSLAPFGDGETAVL